MRVHRNNNGCTIYYFALNIFLSFFRSIHFSSCVLRRVERFILLLLLGALLWYLNILNNRMWHSVFLFLSLLHILAPGSLMPNFRLPFISSKSYIQEMLRFATATVIICKDHERLGGVFLVYCETPRTIIVKPPNKVSSTPLPRDTNPYESKPTEWIFIMEVDDYKSSPDSGSTVSRYCSSVF